ncbi:sterile alpha motif domain-containing protein 5-like [Lingula anatina]|uniref:Sterile alpha motif domain-containing protein 5 n=1 Tax=Lingula anatina TaxID=7574 RepID=A0A1S3JWH1_LINAN|nr:sterile alpha motif domain-containing protein 5-like [Lingula anatina]|eukprot:XP_013414775.1 sterile alpha motif domain-containing protein 5-like [Lingula anatina]
MEENIVENWLRSLNFVGYTQAFLDNGYDDLEVCKQIGEDDLDAIGVVKKSHRKEILKAVHQIREEGATSVYFTLEEPGVTNYPYNDQVSPRPLSNSSSTDTTPTSPSKDIYLPRDYRVDEYEEGKNALVVIPQKKLTAIILEKLSQDRIDLSQLSSQGDVASIEVLAHKYAKEFNTHQSDVLYKLKELQAAGVPTHKETVRSHRRIQRGF